MRMVNITALRALADEPGSIIVTTSALDPEQFVAPHENTRIERFLPHAASVAQAFAEAGGARPGVE